MQDTVFREYDIRGIVGSELAIEQVYQLGRALVAYCVDQNPLIKKLVVGRDGRLSSPVIAQELTRAVIDSGLQVVDIGIVPSPVLYFALHQQVGDIGVMITASHNPGDYNGIKIMLGTQCIWGKQIQIIKNYFHQKEQRNVAYNAAVVLHDTIIDEYVNFLVDHFPTLQCSTMSMVFDCGHAVAGVIIPKLVARFGWQHVHLLYTDLDGTFPCHEADPTVERNMKDLIKTVVQHKAAIGIGFDGDADRMAAVTAQGNLILGDRLLAIFAESLDNQIKRNGVVFNVTMSSGLTELLQQISAPAIMVPTGHAIIKEYMKKHGALLGGEGSCHFFFADRYFGYDDGIYAALRLLEIMVKQQKSLAALTATFPVRCSSHEYRIAVADQDKKQIVQRVKDYFETQPDVRLIVVDGVRVEFSFGWGIVRAANTQPVLSLRFESTNQEGLSQLKKTFYSVLRPYVGHTLEAILKD